MVELTIIKKYLHEFHDGALIAIERIGEGYAFSLESAEMDISDMKDSLLLSERGTIKGKLHLELVQSVIVNELVFEDKLKMKYDYGSIFDFDIRDNTVELQISWRNSPKKPYVNDFSTIVINAKKIWWENIPDMVDPFW
jgi:hypothetical protein